MPDIANQGGEREQLVAFLDYYRAALVDRAWGLNDEQLQTRLHPSTLTIGNLLTHMAWVEQHWFRGRFDGKELSEPWVLLDWAPGADPEMAIADTLSADQILDLFNYSVDDARRRIDAAESLDQLATSSREGEEPWDLRWILIHMIEEYARHCGHADLIRESIDGDLAR
jgi:uncharacterized damage-inducible protein DinB